MFITVLLRKAVQPKTAYSLKSFEKWKVHVHGFEVMQFTDLILKKYSVAANTSGFSSDTFYTRKRPSEAIFGFQKAQRRNY